MEYLLGAILKEQTLITDLGFTLLITENKGVFIADSFQESRPN